MPETGPTTIDLVYVCAVDVVSPARVGEEQTLQINADQFDPPAIVRDRVEQRSHRGLSVATTLHGYWYEGSINMPYITNALRLYWREFYLSIVDGSTFDITTPVGYFGIDPDLQTITAIATGDRFDTVRRGVSNTYTTQLAWRQVTP